MGLGLRLGAPALQKANSRGAGGGEMGIFFGSAKPTRPVFVTALRVDPNEVTGLNQEPAQGVLGVAEHSDPPFFAWRFLGAVVIALVVVLAAIWTAQHNLPDISKGLMDSFAGFSGLVAGLLAGEAPKS
jgi:hypothetical protein